VSPALVLKLGKDKVFTQIKKVVKKTIGQKRVEKLFKAAQTSIGVTYGIPSARLKLILLIEELELLEKQLDQLEKVMEQALVVISKKIITIIHSLLKKQSRYQKELVFNHFRLNQLKQVA